MPLPALIWFVTLLILFHPTPSLGRSRGKFPWKIKGNKGQAIRRVKRLPIAECEDQASHYRTHYAVEYLGQQPASMLLRRLGKHWDCRPSKAIGVIDVGANQGQDNAFFAKVFSNTSCWGNHTTVYLFEPNPKLMTTLADSIKDATIRFGKVPFEVVNVAASDRNGTVPFFIEKKTEHSQISKEAVPGTTLIPTFRLDKWAEAKGITRVPLLMIDAEGFDTMVMHGAEGILHMVEAIIWECSGLLDIRGYTLKGTTKFLEDHGFVSYHIGRFQSVVINEPYYHRYFERKNFQNCFSVPRKSPLNTMAVIPGPCTQRASEL